MSHPINRARIKKLVNGPARGWDELGVIFGFTPVFHFGTRSFIDWRCVPQAMIDILRPETLKQTVSGSRPERTPRIRELLHIKQAGVCHYCLLIVELSVWTIDHKLPRFRGGNNDSVNLIGACQKCNNSKGCLTDVEFIALEPTKKGIEQRAKRAIAKATAYQVIV